MNYSIELLVIFIIIIAFINIFFIIWFCRYIFKINDTQKKLNDIIYYLEKISNK